MYPLSSYVSDDFLGILDYNEDINSRDIDNLPDIGIGSVPSKIFTDKVVVDLASPSVYIYKWRISSEAKKKKK